MKRFLALIVLPVMLLCGFTGCHLETAGIPGPPAVPTNLTATLKPETDVGGIVRDTLAELKWHEKTPGATFNILRTPPSPPLGVAPESPISFKNLKIQDNSNNYTSDVPFGALPGNYTYKVSATTPAGTSAWSNTVTASLTRTAFEVNLTTDENSIKNVTIVQRIDSSALLTSGNWVNLTLRGSTTAALDITAISISQAALKPPGGIKPWDSARDIKVVQGVVLPPNAERVVGPIKYALDRKRDLLIAFDIGALGGSSVRKNSNFTPTGQVTAYKSPPTVGAGEAAQRTRSQNYIPAPNSLYLIEKIEVLGQ